MEIYKLKGAVHKILPVNQITDKFKKQEIIITVTDSTERGVFTEKIKFQAINSNIDKLNPVDEKDFVQVSFKITGREVGESPNYSYYTNLEVQQLHIISKHTTGPTEIKPGDDHDYSELLPGLDEGSTVSGASNQQKIEPPDDLPF